MLHNLALLIDALLTYAIVFLAIPAIRLVVILLLNERIADRNMRRRKAFELVHKAEGDVGEELQEAAEVRQEELQKPQTDRSIIYASDRDILEQELEQEQARAVSIEESDRPETLDLKDRKIKHQEPG
jgi:hypothetical protein